MNGISGLLNNVELRITAFLVLGVTLWLILIGVKRLAVRSLRSLSGRIQSATILADIVDRTSNILFLAISLLGSSNVLTISPPLQKWIGKTVVLLLIFQTGLWLSQFTGSLAKRLLSSQDGAAHSALALVELSFKIFIWTAALLIAFQNIGIDVTALVAGLGIGGVAIALAVQNILGDIFASLTIVLDKPFQPGDFIVVGEMRGTVEHIGIKTTRVRSLSGEQLVFANSDLIGSRLQNFKRMSERRVVFRLNLEHGTPADLMRKAVDIVKEAIQAQSQTRLDRVHFQALTESALTIEAVYFVCNQDYNLYMDIQQAINLTILERFGSEKIWLAFPTQTLHLQRGRRA